MHILVLSRLLKLELFPTHCIWRYIFSEFIEITFFFCFHIECGVPHLCSLTIGNLTTVKREKRCAVLIVFICGRHIQFIRYGIAFILLNTKVFFQFWNCVLNNDDINKFLFWTKVAMEKQNVLKSSRDTEVYFAYKCKYLLDNRLYSCWQENINK